MPAFPYQHQLGDEWDCINPTLHLSVCYTTNDAVSLYADPDCCMELLDAHLERIEWPWGEEPIDPDTQGKVGNEILEQIETEGCGYVLRQLAYEDWLANQECPVER